MLSELFLRNFKAFDELSASLKPITLFFGPNNSGKSSILASIRILVQTIESFDYQVPLLLNGVMGDFGTYRDIVHGNYRGRPIEVSLTLHPYGRILPPARLEKLRGNPQDFWYELQNTSYEVKLAFKYRAKRREIILRDTELKENGTSLLSTKYSEDSERQIIEKVGNKPVPSPLKAVISRGLRMQNFLPRYYFPRATESEGTALSEFLTSELRQTSQQAVNIAGHISAQLHRVEYLGAMRAPPSRTYLFTGEKRRRIGATGENTANILAMDSVRSGSRSLNMVQRVSAWLSKANIASDVQIQPLSDRHYEIRVQHPLTKEYENIADVGYGNSQVIPVLVGGYNLEPGRDVYMVEEPEIHLHPRAQAELGDFFLDLYQTGVQSIAETHSEYIILRLQQHIAKGLLPHDHVQIYYVYSDQEGKKLAPLQLDQDGRFLAEWPEGFFPERLNEAKKLSRIRFLKEIQDMR